MMNKNKSGIPLEGIEQENFGLIWKYRLFPTKKAAEEYANKYAIVSKVFKVEQGWMLHYK